jgi:hypothetical protein
MARQNLESGENTGVFRQKLNNNFIELYSNTSIDTGVRSLTGKYNSVYTNVNLTSGNWNSVYTNVNSNSATYATISFANNKFLPLSGGIVTDNIRFDRDVTIYGNLSCSGTQTFANTIFTTTSALSVVHVGSGPAMWVGNSGTGDIASFYDIDQNIEILHIGGNNGSFPNVGIKTSTPNEALTVVGNISANGKLYGDGSELTGITTNPIPTVTNYLSTNNVQISALNISRTLTVVNGITATGNSTLNALHLASHITETKATPTIASSRLNLNCSSATLFYTVLNAAITSGIDFLNVPASPRVYSCTLQLESDGVGRNVAWNNSIKWAGGVLPNLTVASGKVDTFVFLTHDGGTSWFGSIANQNQ